MEKPNISDYHEVPSSTITGTNYNYKRYSQSLEKYIAYLENEVKKLNKLAVIKPFCTFDVKSHIYCSAAPDCRYCAMQPNPVQNDLLRFAALFSAGLIALNHIKSINYV